MGKGWHNESIRHREAKLRGTSKPASPKKVRSASSNVKTKKNVVSVYEMDIKPSTAVKYHNDEARKALNREDYVAYRYHKKEAIKINEKLTLAKMREKN